MVQPPITRPKLKNPSAWAGLDLGFPHLIVKMESLITASRLFPATLSILENEFLARCARQAREVDAREEVEGCRNGGRNAVVGAD
ncbi:MAG: hypothetical protein ACP5G6_08940 [Conexivisphaera sp.]